MISYLRSSLINFNIGITRRNILDNLIREIDAYKSILESIKILSLLNGSNPNNANSLISNFSRSKSQIAQDLFDLSHFNFKKMDILLNLVQLMVLIILIHTSRKKSLTGKAFLQSQVFVGTKIWL
jgi:hypothetical protein